jgi:formamidopyrimidine-DNA glycosylase
MGKLYVVAAGDTGGVPAAADLGPDADDPALTLEAWIARIRRHSGELKSLLRNQRFVAGIGNAYSDEVLWEARLNPFRRRTSLAPEEVAALYDAMRVTLGRAQGILRTRVPPTFERQVRDHLQVHLRGGQPCPRCGATISQVGGREATSFCRACQR